MSASAAATPKTKRAKPAQGTQEEFKSTQQQVVNVVKAVGPWHAYNPIPSLGHKWMLASHIEISPTCHRIWAWLFDHSLTFGCADFTDAFGFRSPFAVVRRKDGTIEAHLEHMAADLDIHIANLRRYWQEGVEAGIWRNGDEREGARRMYLCTEVKKAPQIGPEAPNQKVCTYSWAKLPTYISKHLQALPAEEQALFWDEYDVIERVDELMLAEAVAAKREAMEHVQNNLFRRFGTEKKRQEHAKNGADPEYLKARAERVAGLQTHLEKYVQTLEEYVRNAREDSTKSRTNSKPDAHPYAFSEPSETREAGGRASVEPSPSHQDAQGAKEGQDCKHLPTPETLVSQPRKRKTPENGNGTAGRKIGPPRNLTDEEKEAESILFAEIRRMQEAYPHTDFSAELVSGSRKSDVIVLLRIMDLVRPENAGEFCRSVAGKFKGLDRNALGKLPSRAPGTPHGPRSLGLIEAWARDYAKRLDELVRQNREQEAQSRAHEMRACLELIADPNETQEAKLWARDRVQQLEKGGARA